MLNFLSLFSGIGAPEKALDRLGINYNLVNYCEIDKYASKSYAAVHNVSENLNLGDITKVDTSKLPNIDMIVYGFPCQDISLAGKQQGLFNDDGTQTRSGLFFEALRIIEDTKPKVAVAENVKNLTGKKFKEQFEIVLNSLERAGYNNYWQVLNAKDYGIPQNRERVFIVSIRKDIDTGAFKFPEPFELELRLKDLLESEVDEKFYLDNSQMTKIVNWKAQQKPFERVNGNNSVVQTLTARGAGEYHSGMITYCEQCEDTTNLQLQVMEATKKGYTEAVEGDSINFEQPNSKTRRGRVGKQVAQTLTTSPQQGVVESFIVASRGRNPENPSDRTAGAPTVQRLEANSQGLCNTITTVQKDNLVCEIQQGTVIDDTQGFDGTRYYDNISPSLRASRSGLKVVTKWDKNKNVSLDTYVNEALETNTELPCAVDEQNVVIRKDNTVGALTTNGSSAKRNNRVLLENLRIRKLTPLECWRLMGFDDEDFYKAEKVNSNTQLYKQAGNSIVVDVLEYLFKEIMEVLDVKKVEDKVIVYECNGMINLEALKEKEPELYAELLADYPAEIATYVFKNKTA